MIERVRAVLVTNTGGLLLIKREKSGVPPYWVFPGGGVESTDATLEAALCREIREEIAGTAEVLRPFHIAERGGGREHFYVARIEEWSFEDRTGPEFSESWRGQYYLEEVPLTIDAIEALNLKPEEVAVLLRDAVARNEFPSLSG